MARARVVIRTCDICGRGPLDGVETRGWILRPEPGSQRKVDVCAEHEKPLRELYGDPDAPKPDYKPTTVEEIEAQKARAKKPAKKAPAKRTPTRSARKRS